MTDHLFQVLLVGGKPECMCLYALSCVPLGVGNTIKDVQSSRMLLTFQTSNCMVCTPRLFGTMHHQLELF